MVVQGKKSRGSSFSGFVIKVRGGDVTRRTPKSQYFICDNLMFDEVCPFLLGITTVAMGILRGVPYDLTTRLAEGKTKVI